MATAIAAPKKSFDFSGVMKRFSAAIVRPVLFLAVAGILLAISVVFRMDVMPEFLRAIGDFVYSVVQSGVIGNLGILFCIGLTCALADKKKGDAAVIAGASFFVFLYANNYWLTQQGMLHDPEGGLYGTGQGMVLGVQVVDMGVFIGTILAFISVAKPEKRAQVRNMLVPAGLVAILAGITEPFEFMYLWASPILFVVNAALDGIFQCILYAFGWRALLMGLIETIPGLIAMPASLSNWMVVIPVGAVAIVAWFFAFRVIIKAMNLAIPGLDDDEELPLKPLKEGDASGSAALGAAAPENVQVIIDGLGGPDNIEKVMNCYTRLRVTVRDMALVDDDKINQVKNSGIVHAGPTNIQVVFGMKVGEVAEAVNRALGREID